MKIKFIAIKNGSGNKSTFIENIQIPLEFENDPMDFLDSFDTSDIMDKRGLYSIIDYFPYIKHILTFKKTVDKVSTVFLSLIYHLY